MRVPLRHARGLVPENLAHSVQAHAVHHQPRRCSMAQSVEAGIQDSKVLKDLPGLDGVLFRIHSWNTRSAAALCGRKRSTVSAASGMGKMRNSPFLVLRR